MIDKEKLDKLIRNDENPKVEFKKSEFIKGHKNSELAKAMAELANHEGGKILIGVKTDYSTLCFIEPVGCPTKSLDISIV
jgi:predicted HTH transcriptional regulator